MLLSLVKYVNLKHILILVLTGGLVFSHYSAYQKGVTKEREIQEKKALIQQVELFDKILVLQENIGILTEDMRVQQETISSSFNVLKKRAQGTTVYNLPECKITDEYLQLYKDAVRAANAKN